MGEYLNNDRDVRLKRFINAEYKEAVEKFCLAKKALLDWSKDTDSIIYKICSECSSKLYDAVEHFLREYINNPGETDKITTIVKLCEKIKDNDELKDIELSVFVTRKEPRNYSTHYGRLSDLGDYYRVLFNLRKLILLLEPNADIPMIEGYSETFDFNKFIYDVEEFAAENCHYMLIADPLNDINKEELENFLSLPWSIVIDFDGRNLNGKLYNSLPNIGDVQTCVLDNVKNQGLSEVTFKLKKTVYLSMESSVAPRKANMWKGVDKSNFEYFINKSKTVEKSRVVIVLAKQLDASSQSFIEKILDVYGNENVKVLFLEGLFTNFEKEDLEERYSDYSEYEISSVILSIEEISKHTNIYAISKRISQLTGIRIPSYEQDVLINDEALISNINLYFEIVDLDKGKDNKNIYSEEDFLKGERITWEALNLQYDILTVDKKIYGEFLEDISYSLRTVENKKRVFSVLHKPGYGGTTLSRRIAWDMHTDYPVLILNVYDPIETWNILTSFYEMVKKGILLIADENTISKTDIDRLQNEVCNSIFPVALLNVRRIKYNTNEKNEKSIYLNSITQNSCDLLEQKCKSLGIKKFDLEKIQKREESLKKIQLRDKCPVLIGLFYLEELFEGTEAYINRFFEELGNEFDSERIKNAMCIISMCDYFGQKKVYPIIIEKILNPTNLKRFSIREEMKKVKELFIFGNNNGSVEISTKHYIISKEIVQQGFLEDGKSRNWKDYIKEKSIMLINLIISVCGAKIDDDIQSLIKDLFIENREAEYLKGKFSILIDSCSNEEDKAAILEYLADKFDEFILCNIDIENEECHEYLFLAHLWGHLGRFYSQKGKMNNPSKAEECCQKALSYSSKIGYFDYVILHIAGDSITKRMQLVYEGIDNIDEFMANIDVLMEGISQAENYFEQSVLYGNEEYGTVGLLTLWTKFLEKFFTLTEVDNAFQIKKIEMLCQKFNNLEFAVWILDGISNTVEKLEYLDIENYSRTAQTIIYNLKIDFKNKYYEKDSSKILAELNEYLSKLLQMSIKDTGKIGNVKRLIIRTLLQKYKNEKTKEYSSLLNDNNKTKKDFAVILEYLSDNILQETRLDSDYSLWFKLLRYSDIGIDEALRKAKEWYGYQKERGVVEPWALYYLYVLNYLRALDGFSDSLEEGEKYRRLCLSVCEEKRKENYLINYSRVRDWLGNGKSVKRLFDDRTVEYSEINHNDNIITVKGRFEEIDPSNRRVYGYLVITEPVYIKGAKVFFKPSECGVSVQQIGHLFEFKMGFTFERLVAFDKSVKDLTVQKKKDIVKKQEIDNDSISSDKNISIMDLVHFKPLKYQKEKGRLSGIILENKRRAFLRKSEVSYDHFVTDTEMESYIGVDNLEVKVLDYNEIYNFYNISVKQIVLGVNDSKSKGDFGKLLEKLKIK